MKLKIALATATAMGLLVGAAYAGANNNLYLKQDGNGNSADVHQSAGPGGNDIGTSGSPFLQDGNDNVLKEIQATGGGFSRGDNDIVKGKQKGNRNSFTDYYSNNAGGNRVNDFTQDGNDNIASISRNASIDGVVDILKQDGNSNFLSIGQSSGTGNHIDLIKMIGSHNGWSMQNAGNIGVRLSQSGSYNIIQEASVQGSNNNTASGTTNVIHVGQSGDYNGRTASIARTRGSNGNGIDVAEIGEWNNFDIRQGLSAGSTGNYATLTQDGSYNMAKATQFGNGNRIIVDQDGNSNTSTTLFDGNDNGVGLMSGAAGALELANSDLTQGTVFQDSSGAVSGSNSLNYNVHGSRISSRLHRSAAITLSAEASGRELMTPTTTRRPSFKMAITTPRTSAKPVAATTLASASNQ